MKTRLIAGAVLLAAACHPSGPKLAFTAQPQNAVAGADLSPAVVVTIEDAAGRTVADSSTLVTLSLSGDAGSELLLGTRAVNSQSGVATFDHLHVDVAGRGYVLSATAVGVAGATSQPFDVMAGPPSQVNTTLRAKPRAVPANGTSTMTLTVTMAEALGNATSGQAVSLSVSGSHNTLSASSGATDTMGQFSATLASTQQELKTVTATAAGVVLTTTVGFTGPCAGTVLRPSVPWPRLDGLPTSVAMADFDGDGKLDIASVNEYADDVSVLLGKGDGTFADAKVIGVGGFSWGLVAGDLNSDGRVDLAVAGSDNRAVMILEGNGNGTFRTGATYPVSGAPRGITAVDLNGDSRLDLVVGNQSGNTISVLLGQDGGTFAPATAYAVGSLPVAMAAADLNGDGKLDLAVANSRSDFVSVLFGNGDGTFGAAVTVNAGVGPTAVVAADVNGDGKLDLVVADAVNGGGDQAFVTLLLGNGDGTFQTPRTSPIGFGVGELHVGDVNGDGNLDLVLSSSGLWVMLGDGHGGFNRAPANHMGGYTFALGDVDGDGRLDVAFGQHGAMGLLLGAGDGTFRGPDHYGYGHQPLAIGAGDLNGDGLPDLLLRDGVLLNQGDDTFGSPVAYPVDLIPSGYALADFNVDGKLDVAVVTSNFGAGPAQVLLGRGDGSFAAGITLSSGSRPSALTAADFNRDGKPDLLGVATGFGAQLLWFPGRGDGTFGDGIPLAGGASPSSAAVADFNGDGKLDIAVTDQGPYFPSIGTLRILLGGGDGTFGDGPTVAAGQQPAGLIAADLDADGKMDLVLNNELDTNFMVFLGKGDGTFRAPVIYSAADETGIGATSLSPIVAGDVNGDGKLDLISIVQGTDYAWVRYGNGDGTFRAPVAYGVGGLPTSVAVADVDRDGTADLLFGGANEASVLLTLGCRSCAPTTCAALANPCGTPPDRCGGTLSCQSCGTGTFCASGSCVSMPQWTPVVSPAPPARYMAAMAFDPVRGKTVLFGGLASFSSIFGDTWERTGTTWTQVSTSGPSARYAPLLAYDASHGGMTLFGGYGMSGSALTDTWSWGGTTWSPLATTGPASNAAMAYDSARGRLVVFVGRPMTETWEWDGASWRRVSSLAGPSPRVRPAMAFDARRGRTVLFGGASGETVYGDTWEWDGIGWQQVAASGPSRRSGATMFYSADRSRMVLFGGSDPLVFNVQMFQDTWEWDGTSWTQVPVSGPPGRADSATTFDGSRNVGLLFGGRDALNQPFGDVWEYQ